MSNNQGRCTITKRTEIIKCITSEILYYSVHKIREINYKLISYITDYFFLFKKDMTFNFVNWPTEYLKPWTLFNFWTGRPRKPRTYLLFLSVCLSACLSVCLSVCHTCGQRSRMTRELKTEFPPTCFLLVRLQFWIFCTAFYHLEKCRMYSRERSARTMHNTTVLTAAVIRYC